MKNKYLLAFMDMVERFARTSEANRLKVACFIIKNGSIISLGINGQPPGWSSEVCEDIQGNTLPTVRHAEDAALQKLWKSTETSEGAEMIITHRPCLQCGIKIKEAGISKVYYRNEYRSSEGIEYLEKSGIITEMI